MVCGDIGDGEGSGGLSGHGGAIECPGVGHGSEACGSYGELQGSLGIHCIGRGQVDRENRGLGLERDGHCSATYRSIGVTGLDTVSSGNGCIHIGDCQGGPRLSCQCTRPLVPLITNGQRTCGVGGQGQCLIEFDGGICGLDCEDGRVFHSEHGSTGSYRACRIGNRHLISPGLCRLNGGQAQCGRCGTWQGRAIEGPLVVASGTA